MTKTIVPQNKTNFINYCRMFYDKDFNNAVYPFASLTEIVRASLEYFMKEDAPPFEGDSLDRENVRDIILANRFAEGTGISDFDEALKDTMKKTIMKDEYALRGETK